MDGKSRKRSAHSKYDKIEVCTALFDQSWDGILIVDSRQHCIDVNPSGITMLGYSGDEIPKLFLPDIIHPEDRAQVNLLTLKADRPLTVKCRLRHRNGKYLLLVLEIRKLSDGNFLVVFDKVSRRQSKWEQANQKNLEEIVNRSPAIAFLWRAAEGWPVEFVSDNIQQFGYTPRNFYSGGVAFASIVHPDDLERVTAEVSEYSQKGYTEFTQEYRIITVDKEIRWVDDHTWVQRDEQGHVLNYQGIVLDITDRKQMEEALRESEEKFRSIVENSLAGIFMVDDSYRFIYANNELCRILGYLRDELTGLDFRMVLSEESQALVTDRYVRRQRGEQVPTRYELKVLRRDGEVRDTEMIVTVVKDASGKPRTMGQLVDITERKRLEHETEERRLFLESVLAAALDAIVISDTRHLISEWNPGAERLFGYSAEEAIGRSIDELITGADSRVFDEATSWTQQIHGWRGITSAETIRYRKDGSPVNVIVSVAPILVGNKWVGVVAIYTDITGRKQAEEALRKSEALYRQAIEVANAVPYHQTYHVNDISVKYDFIGEGIRQITGYSPEEFTEDLWDSLAQERVLLEELAGYSFNEAVEMVRSGVHPVWKCNHRIRAKDGSIHWVFEAAVELRDQDGISHGSIGMFQDITERKQAETERENLISELTEKNSELERFTYTVSHDLKAPLITIAGFLGYLEEDAASGNTERLRNDIQRIQNAVNRMERLLNELLELSRIGRLMNSSEKIPFEELVREALDILHGQLEVRGVTVHTQPDLPDVYGDRQRLTEVLQNLIDNAVKFMGDQTDPRIEIGQHGEENNSPIFFVRDNGIGIAPEHTRRIFGLFDKLDSKTEGTGIGLALVKRIVELHGGRIWVESEPGKGATFYFTIQLKK